MHIILDYLYKRPKSQVAATAFLLVILLGVLDYITGPDLLIFLFYLIPVFLGTWFVGKWAGITLAILSALAWSLSDLLSVHMISNMIIPVWNLVIEGAFFLGAGYVLSMLKTSLEQAQEAARIDYLTGAVTGRYCRDLADRELERMRRYDHSFTMVYMDLDNFKAVNDMFGHSVGDAVLKQVVKTVRENIRNTDTIARMGGDEFVILFPETEAETAKAALAKVQVQLSRAMEVNKWPVTFSFGMVTFISPPESSDQMIKIADKLMYVAKNSGKNAIEHSVYYGPAREDLQS